MSADPSMLRVLLVGLGPTALSALEGLAADLDVVGIVRGGDDPTTERARQLGVPVLAETATQGVRSAVDRLEPDAVVVSSFNRILDAELLGRSCFVNVHYAPLPRGRGRATVNWAIINADPDVAISIHRLVPDLDAGGILFQATVPIGQSSTAATLYAELNELQRQHIAGAVTAAIDGDPGHPQDDALATYLCARTPDDGEIDWSATTTDIDRLIRALSEPFPPAFTWLGLHRLFVHEATPVPDPPVFEGRVPGRVSTVDRSSGTVDILTGDGVLRVRRVRLEGGELVDAPAVITSTRMTLGLRMVDVVAELLRRNT